VDAEVDSDRFDAGDIRFTAYPYGDVGSVYMYEVRASSSCPRCKERVVMTAARFECKDNEVSLFDCDSLEELGRWLSSPHSCGIPADKGEPKIGYTAGPK
jgi:hypothetical protein